MRLRQQPSARAGRRRLRPSPEGLENRRLMSGVITDFPLLPGHATVHAIAPGPESDLWFTAGDRTNRGKVGLITPTGAVSLLPLPQTRVTAGAIAADSAGNGWFAEQTDSSPVSTGNKATARIARITPAGVITEFPIPSAPKAIDELVAGPDGNLWFVEGRRQTGSTIGRITPEGVVIEFSVADGGFLISSLTPGPGGNLWFLDGPRVGRISTTGDVVEFPLVAPPGGTGLPPIAVELTAGPDGNLWFTEPAGKIGRLSPNGVVDEFQTPSLELNGITAGSDGNLWFSSQTAPASSPRGFLSGGRIGRITPGGLVTMLPDQPVGSALGITASRDNALWIDEGGGRIGRIALSKVAPAVASPLAPLAVPPLLLPPGNHPFTGVVASFTDSDPHAHSEDFLAAIDWGFGPVVAGTVSANAHGGFDVTGTNPSGAFGTSKVVTVTVEDSRRVSITLYNTILIPGTPITSLDQSGPSIGTAIPAGHLRRLPGGHATQAVPPHIQGQITPDQKKLNLIRKIELQHPRYSQAQVTHATQLALAQIAKDQKSYNSSYSRFRRAYKKLPFPFNW